jgi:hypothetical protein
MEGTNLEKNKTFFTTVWTVCRRRRLLSLQQRWRLTEAGCITLIGKENHRAYNRVTKHRPSKISHKQHPQLTKPWELSLGVLKDSYRSSLCHKGKPSQLLVIFSPARIFVLRCVTDVQGRERDDYATRKSKRSRTPRRCMERRHKIAWELLNPPYSTDLVL